jgi:predicted Zn-dependent protease
MSETESIQKVLREQKVNQWDIYAERAKEYEIQFRSFEVEAVRGPITNSGYAVRVIRPKGKKIGMGIGTGNSLRPAAIKRCLKAAFIGSRISEFPGYILPKPAKYPSVKVEDPKITSRAETIVKDKAEELMSLLKLSRTVLPTFGKVRAYNVSTVVSNSEGLQAEKRETLFYVELALKAERDGQLAEYWPMLFVRRADDLHLREQVARWTKLAEDTLKAKVPKTAKTTVVFTPQILGEILPTTVGFHCLASSVLRGISRFKKEQQVANKELTVYDDGTFDYGLGSSAFDDEGTPQKKTTLIEKGVHKGFLYDAMYAAAFNVDSTGNGQKLPAHSLAFTRVDLKYSMLPSLQPTNISVEPGNMSLEEMIATTKEGIYLERLSSSSSDSVTTSFGSEIRNAYLIEKGQLSTPLKGGQVNGFLLDSQNSEGRNATGLLNAVSGVSKEARISGRCITPHIRFEGVQIAGK